MSSSDDLVKFTPKSYQKFYTAFLSKNPHADGKIFTYSEVDDFLEETLLRMKTFSIRCNFVFLKE